MAGTPGAEFVQIGRACPGSFCSNRMKHKNNKNIMATVDKQKIGRM